MKAWLQLLRVPNLFTVPGDPLAGFCLALVLEGSGVSFSFPRLYAVLLVSLLLYGSGLLQNDYFDRGEDLRDRPSRPIPSGRVGAFTVICVALLLAAIAVSTAYLIGLETGVVSTILFLIITIYNHSAKRIPIVGPALMGLCRGLNLLLGASILGRRGISFPAVWVAALFLSAFIASVTHIAFGETGGYRSGAMRWAPGATLVVWFSGLLLLVRMPLPGALIFFLVLAGLASLWAFYCGSLLAGDAPPLVVQQTIGRLLRGLLLIQAAILGVAGSPGLVVILLILAAWPISQRLARSFYAS